MSGRGEAEAKIIINTEYRNQQSIARAMRDIRKMETVAESTAAAFDLSRRQALDLGKQMDRLADAQIRGKISLEQYTDQYKDLIIQYRMASAAQSEIAQQEIKVGEAAKRTQVSFNRVVATLKHLREVIGYVINDTARFVKGMYELGVAGAQVSQMTDSWDIFSQRLGLGVDSLDNFRKSSKGTISDMDLMANVFTLTAGSTKNLSKTLVDSSGDLLDIAKAASKLNPSLGDTNFMFQSLARGIKRLEFRLIDNLGLNIKIGEANAKYAASIGKTVEQLNAEEKSQALLNEVLVVGDRLIEQVGGTTDSATDSYERLTAQIKNATDAFKENFDKGFRPAMEIISEAEAIGAMLEGTGQKMVTFGNGMGNMAIMFTAVTMELQLAEKGFGLLAQQMHLLKGAVDDADHLERLAKALHLLNSGLIHSTELYSFTAELEKQGRSLSDVEMSAEEYAEALEHITEIDLRKGTLKMSAATEKSARRIEEVGFALDELEFKQGMNARAMLETGSAAEDLARSLIATNVALLMVQQGYDGTSASLGVVSYRLAGLADPFGEAILYMERMRAEQSLLEDSTDSLSQSFVDHRLTLHTAAIALNTLTEAQFSLLESVIGAAQGFTKYDIEALKAISSMEDYNGTLMSQLSALGELDSEEEKLIKRMLELDHLRTALIESGWAEADVIIEITGRINEVAEALAKWRSAKDDAKKASADFQKGVDKTNESTEKYLASLLKSTDAVGDHTAESLAAASAANSYNYKMSDLIRTHTALDLGMIDLIREATVLNRTLGFMELQGLSSSEAYIELTKELDKLEAEIEAVTAKTRALLTMWGVVSSQDWAAPFEGISAADGADMLLRQVTNSMDSLAKKSPQLQQSLQEAWDALNGVGGSGGGGGGGTSLADEAAAMSREIHDTVTDIVRNWEDMNAAITKDSEATARKEREIWAKWLEDTTKARIDYDEEKRKLTDKITESESERNKIVFEAEFEFAQNLGKGFLSLFDEAVKGELPSFNEMLRESVNIAAEAGRGLEFLGDILQGGGLADANKIFDAKRFQEFQMALESVMRSTELDSQSAADAVNELRRQFDEGEQASVEKFGVRVEDAEAYALRVTEEKLQKQHAIEQDARDALIMLEREKDDEILKIEQDRDAEIAKIWEEHNRKKAEAEEKFWQDSARTVEDALANMGQDVNVSVDSMKAKFTELGRHMEAVLDKGFTGSANWTINTSAGARPDGSPTPPSFSPNGDRMWRSGGYTGYGNPADVAGIVHKDETVIPSNVRRGGLVSVLGFLSGNDPLFGGISSGSSGPQTVINYSESNVITNATPLAAHANASISAQRRERTMRSFLNR